MNSILSADDQARIAEIIVGLHHRRRQAFADCDFVDAKLVGEWLDFFEESFDELGLLNLSDLARFARRVDSRMIDETAGREAGVRQDQRRRHELRAALLMLRLAQEKVLPMLLELGEITLSSEAYAAAGELSAAIDGVTNVIRATPSQDQLNEFERAFSEHQRAIIDRLLGRTGGRA
jgi:hypothetical protein